MFGVETETSSSPPLNILRRGLPSVVGHWFRVALFTATLLLNSQTGRAASSAQDLRSLRPDEVTLLFTTWQQLMDLDGAVWTTFKSNVWTDLSGLLATNIVQSQNNQDAVKKLAESHFRLCLPREWTEASDRVKRAAQEAARLAKASLPVPKTTNSIPEQLAETLWLVNAIEPWLTPQLAKIRSRSIREVNAQAKTAVETAINEYITFQKRLGKLQVIADQPVFIQQLIGVDSNELKSLLRSLDSNGSLTNLAGQVSKSKDILADAEAHARAVEQIRSHQLQAILKARVQVENFSAKIKAWFESNGVALKAASDYHTAVLRTYTIDFPSTLPSGALLRFKVTPPDPSEMRGQQTLVKAELFLVEKATNILVNKAANANNAGSFSTANLSVTNKAPDEEIALGVTFGKLNLSEDQKLSLANTIFPTIVIDQEKVRTALQHFGLPNFLAVSKVELANIAPSLNSFALSFEVQVPGLEVPSLLSAQAPPTKISLAIEGGKITFEMLRAKLRQELDALQRKFESNINAQIAAANVKLPALFLQPIEPVGRWTNGAVGYKAALALKSLANISLDPQKVKWGALFYRTNINNTWQFRLQTIGEPAEMLSALRVALEKQISGLFRTNLNDAKSADALSTFITIKNLRLALENDVLLEASGSISGLPSLPNVPNDAFPDFTFSLSTSGQLKLRTDSLETALRQHAQAIAAGILARLQKTVKQEIVNQLDGAQFSLFGLSAVVSKAQSRATDVAIEMKVSVVGGKQFTVSNLLLLDGSVSGGKLQSPRFDFRNAKVDPTIEEFLASSLNFDRSLFRLSQLSLTPDGVNFQLFLSVSVFGGDIPVADVHLSATGNNGIAISQNAIKTALDTRVRDYLRDKNIAIPEVGIARNIRLGARTSFLNDPQVWVDGEVPIVDALDFVIPFACKVYPDIKVEVDENQAKNQAIKILQNTLGAIFPNSGIDKFGVKLNPITLVIDAKLNPWVFTADVRGIEISQSGIKLPRELSFQVPGFIPVPVAFAIVNPGVVVPLRKDGEVGVVGDITIASEGIDKVIKFRSRLATKISDIGKFRMEGVLVLVDSLPLVTVDGEANFRDGKLNLNARTTGILDKLVQMRDQLSFDANAKRYEQKGSLGVLGIKLTETEIIVQIAGLNSHFQASAQASLPIVTAKIRIKASLNFREIEGAGDFEVGLGGFTLSGAHLDASLRKVELKFEVLLFNVTILAPSINTITPDRVLAAILNLLDFDITSFFESIIKRNVTISFFDKSGKPTNGSIGQGDPPPSGQIPSDNMAQQPPAKSNDETPPVEQTNANTPEGMIAEKTGQPVDPPPGSTPKKHQYDMDVRSYVTGDVGFKFVAGKGPERGLWVEHYTWGKSTWESGVAVSESIKNHLSSRDTMLLSGFWLDARISKVQSNDRRGRPLHGVWHYVTFTRDEKVHVCGEYPQGAVIDVQVPLDELGIKPEKNRPWWNLFGKKEYRFTIGEIAIIREFAMAKVLGNRADFLGRVHIPAQNVGSFNFSDQIFYKLRENLPSVGDVITLQLREGQTFHIRTTSRLFPIVQEDNPRARAVMSLLADASVAGSPITLLSFSGDVLLFARGANMTRAETTLWAIKGDGAIVPPVRLLSQVSFYNWDLDSVWPENSFYTEFTREIATGAWAEASIQAHPMENYFGFVAKGVLAPSKGSVPPDDWAFKVIQWQNNAPRVLGPFKSTTINAEYQKWIERRTLKVAGHRDLKSGDSRLWLLNEFIAAPTAWPKSWNAYPFLLLETIQQ